jgi:hypothetical protein
LPRSFVGGPRKIDTVCTAVSLIKNSRNGFFDVVCLNKRQLPIGLLKLPAKNVTFWQKTGVALQQFVPRCVFFATFPTLSAIDTNCFFRANDIARVSAIIFL